jgi:exodeoxyribonuclease VII large subunit
VQVQGMTGRLPEPRLVLGQFVQQVDELERQLYVTMKHWCRNFQVQLLSHQSTIWERNPMIDIHRQQLALVERGIRLVRGMSGCVLEKRHQSELWMSQLNQLSPLAVLARGYSIVHTLRSGKVVKQSTEVSVGESVRARLHEGELICLVQHTHPPT